MLFLTLLSMAMASASSPSSNDWRDDIAFVQKQIESTHPFPYRRISREQFAESLSTLKRESGALQPDAVALRLMQIVASLRDGHTNLLPGAKSTFDEWFPVRFYQFSDGLFITAIGKEFRPAAGAKVIRIGSKSSDDALRLAESAYASDNDFGALEATVLLSNLRLLRALGIIGPGETTLTLELQLPDGTSSKIALPITKSHAGFEWRFWGEMFGPPGTDLVTAFHGRPASDFMDPERNSELPLHLRARRAYWFTWLQNEGLIYVQLNSMAGRSSHTPENFSKFLARLFAFVDLHPVDKLVLDLRYNSGGNGELTESIVREFIKRDHSINRSGHLFTISGRKTFSAALGLLLAMRQHTSTVIVGEPAGAAMNAAGDPDVATLPHTNFQLLVSTNYFVGSKFTDAAWFVPVEVPATFSSADYFGGRDPAMEAVLSAEQSTPILELLRTQGGEAASAAYEKRKARFSTLSWWEPFSRTAMNSEGLRLLEQGRVNDALAALSMNVDRYPNTWETWDSLAEALMTAKRYRESIDAYRKALQINPTNWNAAAQKKATAAMETKP
jgi:tetratricopeptide (TPR) repeat protein